MLSIPQHSCCSDGIQNFMLIEPGDILDLSELNERVLSPEPSPPPSLPEPQPLPDTIAKDPELISIDLPIVGGRPEKLNAFRRKRKSIIRKLEGNKRILSTSAITNFHIQTRTKIWKE